MITLTPEQEEALDEKLNELFPERNIDYNDPNVLKDMMRNFWSSRVERLTAELRKLDQAAIESAALAWQMVIL